MPFTSENIIKVYDDSSGEYVYVGPDADGLDCCEIRSVDEKGNIYGNGAARITMQPEQAVLVAKAILQLYDKR